MKDYDGLNYEMNEDCFYKTQNVQTKLLYGDPDCIQDPLFTILIPTYQRTDLLEDAIQSALNQWHTYFPWDIIIVDNEKDDGNQNDTEKLIRRIDNKRILYYRNSEHLRPGDNFNRGILMARGKWVMMLHDDDILLPYALQYMEKTVNVLGKYCKKPLGAVSAKYHQFTFDKTKPDHHKNEIIMAQNYYINQPFNYAFYKISHSNILFTGHIGGDVPSNGTTFLRKAVLDVGGFNDDLGISADLILFYCLENKYSVYSTTIPYGFYRWGNNTMSKPESTYNTIRNNYDFRKYVYSKNWFNKLWGKIFGTSQYRRFVIQVIEQKEKSVPDHMSVGDFDDICCKRPNKHLYVIYVLVIKKIYDFFKEKQMYKLYKKTLKDKEI